MEKIKICDMLRFLSEHLSYNLYVSNPACCYYYQIPDGELPLKDKFSVFYLIKSNKNKLTFKDIENLKKQESIFYCVED